MSAAGERKAAKPAAPSSRRRSRRPHGSAHPTSAATSGDYPTLLLPRDFLRPCVLLLLSERPIHGYELYERLRPFGFVGPDSGRLYRCLRRLEQRGLVRSVWERSTGADRRIYELTDLGRDELHEDVRSVAAVRDKLATFVSRYEEFVALGSLTDQPSPPPH